MKRLMSMIMFLSFMACYSNGMFAAEHPGEHPGKKVTKEHPGKEQSKKEDSGKAISARAIRGAIKSYVKNDSKLKGGHFFLYDLKDKELLQLKFVRVHDRVSIIKKEDAHFACADFKTTDGKTTYDLDFWMKKDHHGELEVYTIKVHKKNGKPRYTYQDDEIITVD